MDLLPPTIGILSTAGGTSTLAEDDMPEVSSSFDSVASPTTVLFRPDDDDDADRGGALFVFLDEDEATPPRGRPDEYDGVVVDMIYERSVLL